MYVDEVALSDTNGEAEFYILDDGASSSLHASPPPYSPKVVETVFVRTNRLDDWRSAKRVRTVDFLKIDVEGAEAEVLAGARDTLRLTRHVFIEISPARSQRPYSDVFSELSDAGFSLRGIYNDAISTKRPGTRTYANFWFARN
jgi:hypothetical protein